LNSVTFGQNAPAPAVDVFTGSTPTIYVSNPHATGWGDTWNGRPVVRAASMADIASHNTDGTAHPDIRTYAAGLVATGTVAHAAVEADTNRLGHVQNIGFSYQNNLLYYTAPTGCTGMVFRFYVAGGGVTNIYLWRDNP